MTTQGLIAGIITALIAAAALSFVLDNNAAAMISGLAIGVVVVIALNNDSWGNVGRKDR